MGRNSRKDAGAVDMKWVEFALKLPALLSGAILIVQHVKSATGPEKQQAVVDAVQDGLVLTEFAADKDLLNDADVVKAVKAFIDAKVALMNIITKKKTAPTVP
jgi:hypothetical protein